MLNFGNIQLPLNEVLEYVRNRMHCNFMTCIPQSLYILIVGEGMRNEEGGPNRTAIGILVGVFEQGLGEQLPIVIVHCIIKAQQDHLRYSTRFQTTGYSCTAIRAEAVW